MEKIYYYRNQNKNIGPLTIEELSKNINSEDYVWHKGLEEWTKANELPEIIQYFQELESKTPWYEQIWAVILFLIVFWPGGLFFLWKSRKVFKFWKFFWSILFLGSAIKFLITLMTN